MNKAVALFALALASLALVACGSSDDSTTSGGETTSESSGTTGGGKPSGGATLAIAAAESGLAFSSDTAATEAGKVTVDFDNPQPLQHDVAFEDSSGKEVGGTELITEGETTTTVDLKPGSYTFFCTVPGHREAGMEGTLTVK
ncbi:MAG TPA: plastocyanin/azurin family copper-binding protein [Solirubrobacterales bacterium]|jgi:plastocyanin|nr:plastocyanin/azurin family copper-binding protein [Solirubrobacterales bacterium]